MMNKKILKFFNTLGILILCFCSFSTTIRASVCNTYYPSPTPMPPSSPWRDISLGYCSRWECQDTPEGAVVEPWGFFAWARSVTTEYRCTYYEQQISGVKGSTCTETKEPHSWNCAYGANNLNYNWGVVNTWGIQNFCGTCNNNSSWSSPIPNQVCPTSYSVKDTYLDGYNPNINYGSSSLLKMDKGNVMVSTKPVIKFNLAGVNPNIISAKFRIYINSWGGTGGKIYIYKLNREWSDLEATWINTATKSRKTFWQISGADGILDRDMTPAGIISINNVGYATAVITDLVKSWLKNPASNHGLILINQTPQTYFQMSSAESQVNARPCLITDFPAVTSGLNAVEISPVSTQDQSFVKNYIFK